MSDKVNKPAHYNQGAIECIDALRSMLTLEEFEGHCRASAMGYIWRAPLKGGEEDIRKAIWYLRMVIGDDPRADEKIVDLETSLMTDNVIDT